MLLLGAMVSEEPIEALFETYAKLTFGPKIDWFKSRGKSESLRKNNVDLQHIYQQLLAVLENRNHLIHGETYEESFNGRPRMPYRVGITKNNVDYLFDFRRSQLGDNVYDIQQVKATTKLCTQIRECIEAIQKDLIENAILYEDEPDDGNWPAIDSH